MKTSQSEIAVCNRLLAYNSIPVKLSLNESGDIQVETSDASFEADIAKFDLDNAIQTLPNWDSVWKRFPEFFCPFPLRAIIEKKPELLNRPRGQQSLFDL